MPTRIDLTDKPLELSQHFAYQVAPGSDKVYVAAFQNSEKMTDEETLKPGDVVDTNNNLTAYSLGEATLLQYSQEEDVPKAKTLKSDAAPKPATKSSSTSSSSKKK